MAGQNDRVIPGNRPGTRQDAARAALEALNNDAPNVAADYLRAALAADEAREPVALPERESVDDALMIVESYGPWGADLNDAHRRQIVLADEVLRLRHLYDMPDFILGSAAPRDLALTMMSKEQLPPADEGRPDPGVGRPEPERAACAYCGKAEPGWLTRDLKMGKRGLIEGHGVEYHCINAYYSAS